jgi:cysteine synthase A
VRLARELGPGKTIVTILCDGAGRYASRLFDDAWLKEKGLWEAKESSRDLGFLSEIP